MNIFVQKGVGALLRRRLLTTGNNIDKQSTNQIKAKEAYHKKLATIDLKQASDSVSWALVSRLFPRKWVDLFAISRSPYTLLPDGSYHLNRKVSSMGNGFTFELECCLFLAITRAVVPIERWDDVTVYGDDIICPQEYADEVISVLEAFGFVVNHDKSFVAGGFFESCGKHYFGGVDVTPFFARGSKDRVCYAMQLANKIRLWHDGYSDKRLKNVWNFLKRSSRYAKCVVPRHFGDVGFICSIHELPKSCIITDPHYSVRAYDIKVANVKQIEKKTTSFSFLLKQLHNNNGLSEIATYGLEPIRGFLGKTVIKNTRCYEWIDGVVVS